MAKRIAKRLKMELPGGDAHPGPKLASAGVQMAKFCTDFNAKTADRKGQVVPVIITAYEDKSFDFVLKTTPAAFLLRKAAGVEKHYYGQQQTNNTCHLFCVHNSLLSLLSYVHFTILPQYIQ